MAPFSFVIYPKYTFFGSILLMIQFSLSASISDLLGILTLQQENLLSLLSEEEKREQGFVTVQHTQEQVERMHEITPHVLAKFEDEVVGYVLAMTLDSRNLVPPLIPLFMTFEKLALRGKKITDYNPMVVGQVCVGKSQRGTGLVDKLYTVYREQYATNYDFAITSIALSNHRSLAAHKRVGFKVISTFEDSIQPWAIVLWDWNTPPQPGL